VLKDLSWPQAAKALIEEKGWTQHNACGPNGEFCLSSALSHTVEYRGNECGASLWEQIDEFALKKFQEKPEKRPILNRLGHFHGPLAKLNDYVFKTKQDALDFLDELHEMMKGNNT